MWKYRKRRTSFGNKVQTKEITKIDIIGIDIYRLVALIVLGYVICLLVRDHFAVIYYFAG